MKPLALHGHEKPITQIKYNRDGDLLFSASKDRVCNVWYSINGERLGTFAGHGGAVWCLDVDWTSEKFISGAADNTLKYWNCETGACLGTKTMKSAIRTCSFSYCGNLIAYTTDSTMGMTCEICIVDTRTPGAFNPDEFVLREDIERSRVNALLWASLDQYMIAGHDRGDISKLDIRMGGKEVEVVNDHGPKTIMDLQLNKQGIFFISACKDHTSKLYDVKTLKNLKTYKTERPVNSASISPDDLTAIVGGGEEAMTVTQTSSALGKFDSRFFHTVFECEFARLKGHFGPINSLAYHPDGQSFSSGGEDGYVRIQNFDPSFFTFKLEY
ncbi:unnamed protein product [Cyprideis torosa]|uniref:Eukaryotic translation initiation factor 3 subunit I n=1 Tax=Cyprideis torosa TaxID=163714 RepID=A0A7R8W466_9CRUS|nr:unnamed protein product [Cyprideis torosa]CAG0879296.1 unnamed protein product [Cyprideis torosa]